MDNRDREAFLSRLGTVAVAFHVEIHAYALMGNHVHLFVRTREANLSRFMQRVLSGYTQWFNIRHDTCGHLFQGRYKALVVDRNAYGAEVSRYIHLNPVRTVVAKKEEVARQQAVLRGYRWSSYSAMIGIAPRPEWLERKETLSRWGDSVREQERNYARFVEEGLMGEITDVAEEARAQSILGRDRFVDRIRRILIGRKRCDMESKGAHLELTAERIGSVMERVARAYKVKVADLMRTGKGCGGNEARQVALWLARERCGAQGTMREIGTAMGNVSRSGVSAACRRITQRARRDKHLARMLARLS